MFGEEWRNGGPLSTRVVLICNIIFGFWLPFSFCKLRSFEFPLTILSYFNITCFAVLPVSLLYSFYQTGFKSIIISGQFFFILSSQFNSLFSVLHVQIRRKKVVKILSQFQLLNEGKFVVHSKSSLKRFSRFHWFILLVPVISMVMFQSFGLFTLQKHLSRVANKNASITLHIIHENNWLYIACPEYYAVITYTISTLFHIKRVVLEALILGFICLLSEQVRLLRARLPDALKMGPLATMAWLHHQREIARLLTKLNSIFSPCVVVTMLLNVCSTCLSAFFAARVSQFANPIFGWSLVGFCAMFLTQTFLYCYVGHRIKYQGCRLSEVIRRSDWLRVQSSLVHGLSLISTDCVESFVVRGGPFFILSLEFFASFIGLALTYFVVLSQMK